MALPQEVRNLIKSSAEVATLKQQDSPSKGHLFFLTAGALGVFAPGQMVCSGLIVPGSVYGWESLLEEDATRDTRALVPCQGLTVPLAIIKKSLNNPWIFKFLAANAVMRSRNAAAEASCNALHTASQRTAKWILRLHTTVRDPKGISITQARLAEILGFQRTSINASCGYLKDRGAIEVRRGRLIVTNVEILRTICCTCDV